MNVDHDENPRKAAAQALAAQGFHVLPVKAGEKRPDPLLAPDGFKNCTTDAETVGGWFDVKSKLNVGIACGAEYGLLVVDVDIKGAVDGRKALSDLWLDQPTLTADTPSGGFHMYYRHPGTALKAKLPGIDLKGADGGGYVLAPPSILPNGAYTWRDPEIPIAPFPPYLLDELRADQPPRANGAAKATGPAATLVVSEGRRHARLVELGAIYRGKGLASDEIETLLWEHAARYFDPPFSRDNAEHEREIEAVVRWYGGKAASADDVPQLLVIDSTDLRARAAAVPDRALIDPLLPEAGNLMIYGPSGHGKSHLALSIALALARGMPLLDWTVPSVVPVLFCDGEMPLPELVARLNQYLGGASPPATLWWAAARAQPGDMPDLADPAAQGHYLAAIESCNARAVVFDNLSCLRTTTADSPENSVEAWHPIAAFLRRLNGIGVATVTVHHAAKSGSQRGSSMHVAVMDTVLRVAAPGEGQGDPTAELDVEIVAEKHRRFGGEATLPIRARVIQDCDGLATWHLAAQDPLVEDVVRLRKAGQSIRQIAQSLKRSKAGIEKALMRAKARGLLPLGGGRMSSVLPSYSALSLVVQPGLFDAVPPSYLPLSAVGQKPKNECPTLREKDSRTATAQASTPDALARAGGTPTPNASDALAKRKTAPGRTAQGLACIGCIHYRSVRHANGALQGVGHCTPRDRHVAANDRRPCALYQFTGAGYANR